MTENRRQRTEDGRQRVEDRGQRAEDGGQKTEDRGQMVEDGGIGIRISECGLRPVGAIGACAPEGMRNVSARLWDKTLSTLVGSNQRS